VRPVQRRVQAEGRHRRGFVHIEIAGDARRGAELVEVVLVGKGGRLVEPLRREKLGRHARAFAAVGETDAGGDEKLRRLRQCDDPEAEGHAQAHVALVKRDLFNGEFRFFAHLSPSMTPWL